MNSRILRQIDWIVVLIAPVISIYGLFAIYSAAGAGQMAAGYTERQLTSIIGGLVLLAVFASLDDHILPRLSGFIYWGSAALLLAVDIIGDERKGSQRWLNLGFIDLQPSEPAKIALIITLAVFYLKYFDEIREFRTVLKSLVHVGVPLLLVFKQPDLGTSLVFGTIWLGISLAAGVRWKHILAVVLTALCIFTVGWNVGVIKDYQKQRLTSFINPDADPRGSGYHIRQSKIAIGAGEMTGSGYLKGPQSQLDFIPEQHTDFIFTVIGEELGFVGSAGLVVLYWILVSRIVSVMQSTEERLGRMMAGGILAMFLFHICVNIGMTIGIMPVTGVPLPLFSYGRSNLISTMAALGLVMGIYARRHRIAF